VSHLEPRARSGTLARCALLCNNMPWSATSYESEQVLEIPQRDSHSRHLVNQPGASLMTEKSTTEKSDDAKQRCRIPRGRVTIFPNWCKGCNLCIEFCPTDVLEQGDDGRVIVAHPEQCTACRWCERHCPDFAIFVSDLESEEEAE
jgi:2-oxoglutarate ferredoxin oxidoreductase subunit delta